VLENVLKHEVETRCRARDDEQPRIFLVQPIPHGFCMVGSVSDTTATALRAPIFSMCGPKNLWML